MKSSSVEFKKKKCGEWLWCLSAMKTLEATCSKQAFDEATYIHKRLFCHTCRTCSPLSDLLSAAVLGITAESDWIKRSALEWQLSTLLLLFLIFSCRKVAGIQCAANKNTVFQQGNKRRKRTTIYSKVTNYYKHTKRSCWHHRCEISRDCRHFACSFLRAPFALVLTTGALLLTHGEANAEQHRTELNRLAHFYWYSIQLFESGLEWCFPAGDLYSSHNYNSIEPEPYVSKHLSHWVRHPQKSQTKALGTFNDPSTHRNISTFASFKEASSPKVLTGEPNWVLEANEDSCVHISPSVLNPSIFPQVIIALHPASFHFYILSLSLWHLSWDLLMQTPVFFPCSERRHEDIILVISHGR